MSDLWDQIQSFEDPTPPEWVKSPDPIIIPRDIAGAANMGTEGVAKADHTHRGVLSLNVGADIHQADVTLIAGSGIVIVSDQTPRTITLSVDQDLTLDSLIVDTAVIGDLEVTDTLSVDRIKPASDSPGGAVVIDGLLKVDEISPASGSPSSSLLITGDLEISGVVTGDLEVSGTLSASDVFLSQDLHVSGTLYVDVIVPDSQSPTGAVTLDATVDITGDFGIGTTTIPHGGVGIAKVAIDGTDSNADGPHVQITTSSDDYPVIQLLNWSHDNIAILFDSYYDGAAWRSSDSGSSFRVYKNSDRLSFGAGVANAGNAVSWTEALRIESDGDLMVSQGGNRKLQFRDDAIYMHSADNGFLDAIADTGFRVTVGGTNAKLRWNINSLDLVDATNAVQHKLDVGGNETVFNERGLSVDFRVEGTSDTHLIFVDGSEDMVGISLSNPAYTLHVGGDVGVDGGVFVDNIYPLSESPSTDITLNHNAKVDGHLDVDGNIFGWHRALRGTIHECSDWIGPDDRWRHATGGAGATLSTLVSVGTDGNHWGKLQHVTGTTATGYATAHRDANFGCEFGGGEARCGIIVQIPILSDGTNRFIARVGFGDVSTGADHADGIYFEYSDNLSSGNWRCCTAQGGAQTKTDSGISVAANTWYLLEFIVSSDGNTVHFFIDGAAVATTTTNIPGAWNRVGPCDKITKTVGTTSRTMQVDLFEFEVHFNTPR